jgi:hypothetical protein
MGKLAGIGHLFSNADWFEHDHIDLQHTSGKPLPQMDGFPPQKKILHHEKSSQF